LLQLSHLLTLEYNLPGITIATDWTLKGTHMTLNNTLAGLAAFVLTLPAMATSVYTYTGNDFDAFSNAPGPYTTSDFVTGSFTVSAPLAANLQFSDNNVAPIAYHFTDGVQTFTNNSGLTDVFFDFATDSKGNIIDWFVSLSDGPNTNRIATSGDIVLTIIDFGAEYPSEGQVMSDPGKWTTVPEPGSLLAVGAGLLGVGLRRRKVGR
jgi:hypothetical protein